MTEQDQVDDILVTLGTKPEGLYGNVRNRLDILEYRIDPSGTSFITTGEFYIDLYKGFTTDITGVPTVVGACYIDTSKFPTNRSVKFRCIIQSSSVSATYAAVMDLYDIEGTFGVPAPVTGSQINNTAVLDPQTAAVVETDLTNVFAGSITGTFEARLWMVTASDTNVVTCKSAQLVIGGV